MEKVLGKIRSAEFGTVRDYPYLMGLELFFDLSDGTTVGTGSRLMENFSSECKWNSPDERNTYITKMLDAVYNILKDAKVNHVSELINKPVVVTIDKNTFKDFRILTEVL